MTWNYRDMDQAGCCWWPQLQCGAITMTLELGRNQPSHQEGLGGAGAGRE